MKKRSTKGVVVRHCGNDAGFQKLEEECADGSCEVSVCSESYCVA